MVKNRILCFTLCLIVLVSAFAVPVSAADTYIEFYQYNGQAISTAVADILSGYAINYIKQYPDSYRYWFAFRLDEYRYAIVCVPDIESYNLDVDSYQIHVSAGKICVYNQRLFSYKNGNQTYYQAAIEPELHFGPFDIQLTRGFVIGNLADTINVHPEYESILYFDYIKYILYTVIVFLMLFLAFKFLNKRWLLP